MIDLLFAKMIAKMIINIEPDLSIELRNKIASFRESTGTNKSIQLVMVTTYGVKENKYSGIVGNQVLLDDLFKE